MKLKYALFLAFLFGYAAVLVTAYWEDKLGNGLSGTGMVFTFLSASLATLLLCLFATRQLLTIALIAAVAVVFLTLIVFWITG